MKLSTSQLNQHIQNNLSGGYWISGDETLLVLETCDNLRQAGLHQGFTNRSICHVDAHTDWQSVLGDANALSLFTDRNLIEIRFNTAKPNSNAIKALGNYFSDPNPDTLIIISSPKLDTSFQKTKAYKALEATINTLMLWPVSNEELPKWIRSRLQGQDLSIDNDALTLLCHNVEGNLLAAQQQIMQLALLNEDKQITISGLQDIIANNARFDVFGTLDKALQGDTAGSLRALDGLKAEGLQAANISWVFVRELQTLINIRQLAKEVGPDKALQRAGVWKRREPLIRNCLRRLKLNELEQCLLKAQHLDAAAKGQANANAWDEAALLIMHIGGCAISH